MSRWSRYLHSSPVEWLMAACAATQGIYLAEKWAIQQWVSLLICGVPLGIIALSRLLKLPGIWRVIGPTAHVLLAALTVDHLVRTQPTSAEYLLILLLVVGAAIAVAILMTRASGSHPEPGSPDSGTAGQTGPSNEPIE